MTAQLAVDQLIQRAQDTVSLEHFGSDSFRAGLEILVAALDKLDLPAAMDFRDKFGEDRIIDVHYAHIMREPMQALRDLYTALCDEFTPEAGTAMQAWLDANPQNKFGQHDYKLSEYGLTADELRKKFERYLSHYPVQTEGS